MKDNFIKNKQTSARDLLQILKTLAQRDLPFSPYRKLRALMVWKLNQTPVLRRGCISIAPSQNVVDYPYKWIYLNFLPLNRHHISCTSRFPCRLFLSASFPPFPQPNPRVIKTRRVCLRDLNWIWKPNEKNDPHED